MKNYQWLRTAYRFWILLIVLLTMMSAAGRQHFEFWDFVRGVIFACLPGAFYWAITGRKPRLT